jgi:hypothetical protein
MEALRHEMKMETTMVGQTAQVAEKLNHLFLGLNL